MQGTITGVEKKESIGQLLKQAREEQGYTLRDVEEETKIRIRYIQALEEEDFASLPGQVYVKGFLRSYAKFLGISGDKLINMFNTLKGEEKKQEKKSEEKITIKAKEKPLPLLAILRGIVIIALLAVAISYFSNNWLSKAPEYGEEPGINGEMQIEEPDPSEQMEPDEEPDLNEQNLVTEIRNTDRIGEYTLSGVPIELTAKAEGGDCWIRVIADGKIVAEEILASGDEKVFTGQAELLLKAGNPGVLVLKLNGKELGIAGTSTVVKDFIITVK
ncbi:MAG: helix-turn-helix domain-containing protein [bacterium]